VFTRTVAVMAGSSLFTMNHDTSKYLGMAQAPVRTFKESKISRVNRGAAAHNGEIAFCWLRPLVLLRRLTTLGVGRQRECEIVMSTIPLN
jgi:hypothetical protein